MPERTPPREIVVRTEERVATLLEEGGLILPERYAWQNALKSAWLVLQDATVQGGPNHGKRVLDIVSERSVANALLDMVAQGLNVGAKQGYFVPYGNALTFQRSYFGSIAVAKRVAGVADVRALPVYEGDTIELEIVDGIRRVVSHRQTFDSLREGTLVGAYAIVLFRDDRPNVTDVMSIDEIRTSWMQSRPYKKDPKGSTHASFPEAMALRTVIQRALKPLINGATDDHLFLAAFNRDPSEAAEEELALEVEEDANTIEIDVDPEPASEPEPEPAPALESGDAAMLDAVIGFGTAVLDELEREPEPEPAPKKAKAKPEADDARELFPAELPF